MRYLQHGGAWGPRPPAPVLSLSWPHISHNTHHNSITARLWCHSCVCGDAPSEHTGHRTGTTRAVAQHCALLQSIAGRDTLRAPATTVAPF
ncbi:hypothetical protein TcasGA2_TC032402 [Tribolium castaneum]|uniref:Uncharacterized protein n=1 Tax=Tribolium castaneum TaxID=7070 RepID=A0A139WLG5_TRICA|nr:hypothetical protein TcasGA2_TC032402 [Tribolium castaneum]